MKFTKEQIQKIEDLYNEEIDQVIRDRKDRSEITDIEKQIEELGEKKFKLMNRSNVGIYRRPKISNYIDELLTEALKEES